jgi:trigger factor
MQVSIESTGALGRRMTVQVPAERIDQEVESRLKSLARTARIDGFRPGKVPVSVVHQKFGRQVRQEVANEVMNATLREALAQEQLRPAGEPAVEPRTVAAGQALEFTATFEIFPEFAPVVPLDQAIEKPLVEIRDQDIDAMLDKLQKQRMTWEKADRAAAHGDRVTIDFEGTVEGEAFEGGQGKGVEIEIGSGKLIDGFEEGLIGATVGEERVLDLQFPDNYRNESVAGRPVQFKVIVRRVEEARLPPLDDDFARAFGVLKGGVDALREEVTRNMQRELGQAITATVKDRVFDLLLENNPVDVPGALLKQEVDRLQNETSEQIGNRKGMSLPRDLFEPRARRRVALGLIIGEIVRRNNIQVDPDRVRRTVESFAASYENPDEVVRWYYENHGALSTAQSVALEEQVMEWILDQVAVEENPMDFEELMKLRQSEPT